MLAVSVCSAVWSPGGKAIEKSWFCVNCLWKSVSCGVLSDSYYFPNTLCELFVKVSQLWGAVWLLLLSKHTVWTVCESQSAVGCCLTPTTFQTHCVNCLWKSVSCGVLSDSYHFPNTLCEHLACGFWTGCVHTMARLALCGHSKSQFVGLSVCGQSKSQFVGLSVCGHSKSQFVGLSLCGHSKSQFVGLSLCSHSKSQFVGLSVLRCAGM